MPSQVIEVENIKVRAWDTHRKKMWSAEELGKDQLTISPDGRGFVNINSLDTRLSEYLEHMVPLLFTTRKDEDGKEIYEGDVVTTPGTGDGPNYYEVRFKDGCFWIYDSCGYDELFDCNPKVVGNIFENPELKEIKE